MRTLTLLSCAAVAATALAAPALLANVNPDISGDWLRTDGTARIHIAPCGPQLCATNTWIKDATHDEQVGDQLIMTLQPQGDSSLTGAAFDVRRKLNYSMNIVIDQHSMVARGCVVAGVVCKTMSWTRES